MSRSRKKTAGFCDRNPYMKACANRKFRRMTLDQFENGIGAGKSNRHKRYSNPYDICDFKCLYFSDQEVQNCVALGIYYKGPYCYYMK